MGANVSSMLDSARLIVRAALKRGQSDPVLAGTGVTTVTLILSVTTTRRSSGIEGRPGIGSETAAAASPDSASASSLGSNCHLATTALGIERR